MQIVIDIPIDKLTCNKCPCCNGDEGLCELYYLIHKRYIGSWDILWDDRPKECPVIVLPDHHGDLIDRDNLLKTDGMYKPIIHTGKYGDVVCVPSIMTAPTVLVGSDKE